AVLTNPAPNTLVNGTDPNGVFGAPPYTLQGSAVLTAPVADSVVALAKTDSDSGIYTLTGTQAPSSLNDLKGIVFTDEELNGVKTLTASGALPAVLPTEQGFDPSKLIGSESLE